jgi:beta-lactamase regulating signal transducer with metallopeptidase domain
MIVLNTVLFALAALLGSLLLPALAWVLGRGKAAALRHLLWTGAFAALLALPVVALLLPSQLTFLLATPAAAPVTTVTAPAPVPAFGTVDFIITIAALWLAGLAFHLVKLAIGGVGLICLYRKSVAHIPHGIDAAPFRGLGWQLRVRTSPGEAGPLTWGVVRPVVLLPKASVTWPRERLTSVLLHEAAHVRRQDCLCRLIALAACALYWPNPLMWLAARAMRRDGESAADDAVIAAGVRPTRYAEHLVGLAREFSGTSRALTLAMAEHRMLDARVKSILDPAQSRSGVTKMDVWKIGISCLALTAGLALVRPSLAEAPAPKPESVTAEADEVVFHNADKTGAFKTPKHMMIRAVADAGTPGHVVMHISDADVPAPPEPPVPPAPQAVPEPPAPPVRALTEPEKAAIRRAASADAARAIAEARRTIADAHIDETIARAMRQAEQSLRQAKVSEAQAHQAVANMHIDRIVADAMKQAARELRKAQAAPGRAATHSDDENSGNEE